MGIQRFVRKAETSNIGRHIERSCIDEDTCFVAWLLKELVLGRLAAF